MRLKDLQQEIHRNAKDKGWWEGTRSPLDIHMLCVSEIAEATEEVRKGKPDLYQIQKTKKRGDELVLPNDVSWEAAQKPEGESVELADTIIRILDYAQYKGWDMEKIVMQKHEYNKRRPHRHGGKRY